MALADSKCATLEVAGDGTNNRAQGYVGHINVGLDPAQIAAVDVTGVNLIGVVLPPAGLKADGVADVCVAGECYALVDGDSVNVAIGDLLDVTAAGTFIQTARTGKFLSTAITAGEAEAFIQVTRAVAMEAETDATPSLRKVYILNNPIGAAG